MLEFKNVNIYYDKKHAIKNASFVIRENRIVMVVGKNGAGKSSIVNAINGTINYNGEITIDLKNIKEIKNKEKAKLISILPQKLPLVHIKVKELLEFGRNCYTTLLGGLSQEDKKAIDNAVNIININDLLDKYLDELSGGELQKAYLAMVISQNSNIIVLDEPVTHLDKEYESLFLRKLIEIKNKLNKTIIIVIHDINDAVNFGDDIIVIEKGNIVFNDSVEKCLNEEVLEKTFNLKKYVFDNKVFFDFN